MLNLKDFLTGARFVPHSEIKPRAKWQYNGIIKRAEKTQDKRSKEQIWADTYNSIACEIGVARSLPKGEVNEQAFDHTDISTWGYDVMSLGIRFEIKYEKFAEDWYSFSHSTAQKIMDRYRQNGFDYLITASTYKAEGGLEIWPRLLINPETFKSNISKSHYDNYKPLFYNQYVAKSDGDCQIYNEGIIKEMKKTAESPLHSLETVL
tara:strand:- start:397 stop:1017 length:621 start_codon:yes stop_codon:yes gene_type:complete